MALVVSSPFYAVAGTDVGEGHDHRTFHADGRIDCGQIGGSYTADLVMYLAGDQFIVMEELIKDFQSKHPQMKTVFCETIPPGQIFKGQILKQGEIAGQKIAQKSRYLCKHEHQPPEESQSERFDERAYHYIRTTNSNSWWRRETQRGSKALKTWVEMISCSHILILSWRECSNFTVLRC